MYIIIDAMELENTQQRQDTSTGGGGIGTYLPPILEISYLSSTLFEGQLSTWPRNTLLKNINLTTSVSWMIILPDIALALCKVQPPIKCGSNHCNHKLHTPTKSSHYTIEWCPALSVLLLSQTHFNYHITIVTINLSRSS